jgi:hypothetical protein
MTGGNVFVSVPATKIQILELLVPNMEFVSFACARRTSTLNVRKALSK